MNSVDTISPEQGMFELSLMNGEASIYNFDDLVVESINRGVAPEIITRLRELWGKTKYIAGEIISVGKIIVQKIFEFLKANPKLTIGLALGAAISALIAGIPFIGPLVAPVSTTISTLYGAGVGAAMEQGDLSGSPYSAAIELASKFFELLKSIFNAVKEYWLE